MKYYIYLFYGGGLEMFLLKISLLLLLLPTGRLSLNAMKRTLPSDYKEEAKDMLSAKKNRVALHEQADELQQEYPLLFQSMQNAQNTPQGQFFNFMGFPIPLAEASDAKSGNGFLPADEVNRISTAQNLEAKIQSQGYSTEAIKNFLESFLMHSALFKAFQEEGKDPHDYQLSDIYHYYDTTQGQALRRLLEHPDDHCFLETLELAYLLKSYSTVFTLICVLEGTHPHLCRNLFKVVYDDSTDEQPILFWTKHYMQLKNAVSPKVAQLLPEKLYTSGIKPSVLTCFIELLELFVKSEVQFHDEQDFLSPPMHALALSQNEFVKDFGGIIKKLDDQTFFSLLLLADRYNLKEFYHLLVHERLLYYLLATEKDFVDDEIVNELEQEFNQFLAEQPYFYMTKYAIKKTFGRWQLLLKHRSFYQLVAFADKLLKDGLNLFTYCRKRNLNVISHKSLLFKLRQLQKQPEYTGYSGFAYGEPLKAIADQLSDDNQSFSISGSERFTPLVKKVLDLLQPLTEKSIRHICIESLNIPNWTMLESLQDLTQLEDLEIISCGISGEIPFWMGKLKNLKRLNLSRNQLHGPIPESLKSLELIEYINVSDNFLSGSLPSWLNNMHCRHLHRLNLNNNKLTNQAQLERQFAVTATLPPPTTRPDGAVIAYEFNVHNPEDRSALMTLFGVFNTDPNNLD